jgi:hypothetical protein
MTLISHFSAATARATFPVVFLIPRFSTPAAFAAVPVMLLIPLVFAATTLAAIPVVFLIPRFPALAAFASIPVVFFAPCLAAATACATFPIVQSEHAKPLHTLSFRKIPTTPHRSFAFSARKTPYASMPQNVPPKVRLMMPLVSTLWVVKDGKCFVNISASICSLRALLL